MTTAQALVGLPLFVAALVLATWGLLRTADRMCIRGPFVTGFALRAVVAVAAHAVSVAHGDGGTFYIDDRTYADVAERIAASWSAGQFVDPASAEFAGSVTFGYPALVATVFLFVGPSILAAKLVNVLLGAATVLLVAAVADRIVGPSARRPAAWTAALLPTLIWWSGTLLKEAVVAALVVGAVLAALSLKRRPSAALVLMTVAGLGITRVQAALTVTAALVAAAVAVLVRRGERRRIAGLAAGLALAAFLALAAIGRGSPVAVIDQLQTTAASTIDTYQGSNVALVPVDIARGLIAPFPWVFESETFNWYMPLYPGMWVLFALYPTAVLGVWRLRGERDALIVLLVPIVGMLVLNALTIGLVVRQRSSFEPLLAVLAAAGMTTVAGVLWRAALGLGIVGLIAVAHSGSVLVAAGFALAVLAAGIASLRAPRRTLVAAPSTAARTELLVSDANRRVETRQ